MMILDDEQIEYLPTPQQITEDCARIREAWSPREERRRRAWSIAGPVIMREVSEAVFDDSAPNVAAN